MMSQSNVDALKQCCLDVMEVGSNSIAKISNYINSNPKASKEVIDALNENLSVLNGLISTADNVKKEYGEVIVNEDNCFDILSAGGDMTDLLVEIRGIVAKVNDLIEKAGK